ncbi:unnamed protein product [Didymodactylos carnosus]|uniref:RNA-directed DNA polymerase n=1 Tax=Didymodactylos carnosus TaxID=1234261 RepID=A0A815IER1_9BILA|nr:unnamed protein product [Didymodactylos carnosus]CAF4251045.1 unnamed protein product [Didymodactylos carnosus]
MKILIDTGANQSFINEKSLRSTNHPKYLTSQKYQFFMADGLTPFIVTGAVQLKIQMNGTSTTITALVAQNLCTDVILGMDYIFKYDLGIQPQHKTVSIKSYGKKTIIPMDKDVTQIRLPVKLSRSIQIRPESEQSISVDVGVSAAILSFRPSSNFAQRTSTFIPHSLLNIQNYRTNLTVYNPSKFPCYIKKGIILGISTYQDHYACNENDKLNDNEITYSAGSAGMRANGINAIESTSVNDKVQQEILKLIDHIKDKDQHHKLKSLLYQFQKTFDTSQYTTAKTIIMHAIETYPHTPPVSKCYPSNPTSIEEMREIVNKLLEAGLVRKSKSPYAAPALLTRKKDNTWRLVVDYKKLNAVTIKDNHPLPNMETTIQTLGGGYNYFTKLDLKSGFWQVPIAEKDRHKTAFTTPFGLYEWNVLPQGLRNAPPTFQRIMNQALLSCTKFALVYLDDIMVYSKTYEEHLYHVQQVLHALKLHNLTLNPSKCEIAKQRIEYLGHIITSSTVTPLMDKIKAILLLKEPKTLAQATRFIGGLSWYRKFIPQFATIAAPIHAITNLPKQTRYKFKWAQEQSKSFHALKHLLTSKPLLLDFPDDTKPVIVTTDASKVGIGGVLQQEIGGERKTLYYHSELMSPCQQRYHPMEQEALAIFKCITRMRSFLIGRSIIIYTDNCPLCHMMEKKVANRRVEKMALLLQEYNIEQIIHIKGRYNCLLDYLSRHPISNDDELFDYEYGLEPKNETSQPLIGRAAAVITRSKFKANATNPSSNPPVQQQPTSPQIAPSIVSSQPHYIIENFDITKLKEEQKNDINIQKIINDLKKNPKLSFELKDDILYKLILNDNGKTKRKVIYIPSLMIKPLMISYHDNPLIGGHFASNRTLNKIKQQFWWPQMKQSRAGFLHPIPPPDGPNQLIGIDYCGPFPQTPNDNRYVLCLTDYFTKFVTAIPLPDCSAQTTAQVIFTQHICRYGVPKAILSDQGTSFKNQLMHAITKLIGFNHIFSTPYHPQTNGQVERFNATFITQIAKLTDNESNNWDEYLYPVVFAYNTGIHSTTNFSPYELTFGSKANLPTDHPPSTFTSGKPNDYFYQLIQNLKRYHATAKENILHQQRLYKTRYDRQRQDCEYDLGATVLTRIFTTRSKLDPKFSLVPKIIIRRSHPVYWVEDMETKEESRVHVNDIRPLMIATSY